MVLFNNRNVVKYALAEPERSYLKLTEDMCNKNCPDEFELIFDSNEDLLSLQIAKKMWDDIPSDERSNFSTLYLQYCPYSLQEDLSTFRIVADLINDLNFSTVMVADPHSATVPTLLRRCNVWYPIKEFLDKYNEQYPGGMWDFLFYMSSEDAIKYTKAIERPYSYRYASKRPNTTNDAYPDYDIMATEDDLRGEEILLVVDASTCACRDIQTVVSKLYDMGVAYIDLYITHLRPADKAFIKECVDGKHPVRAVYSYDCLQILKSDKICETITLK